MKSVVAALVVALWGAGVASAQEPSVAKSGAAPSQTYAQALVNGAIARHPEAANIAMHVVAPGGSGSVVIASNEPGQVGQKSGATEVTVAKTGKLHSATVDGHLEVVLPLLDASSRRLGALSVVLASPASANGGAASGGNAAQAAAQAIRDELARRISHLRNLLEPAQLDARVPLNSYAQKLLDEALDQHRDIVIMAMHATIPNTQDNVIVASNIGRIGKRADEDDMRVVNTGKSNLEVNETGDRFEAELVLEDSSGHNIGAIGVVYPYKKGDDKVALQHKAEQVRDELARHIPSAAALFEPTGQPVAASGHAKNWTPPAKKLHAQQLIDRLMAAHPELISATLHGVPPGLTNTYTMFAGSYPDRIGNADDPDDIDISKKGITIVDPRWHRPHDTVRKFVMMLPLRDAAGENVGEIVLAYKNPPDSGKTEKDFFLAALALRDGLQAQIQTYAGLFQPVE